MTRTLGLRPLARISKKAYVSRTAVALLPAFSGRQPTNVSFGRTTQNSLPSGSASTSQDSSPV